jgi:hypothetical protein
MTSDEKLPPYTAKDQRDRQEMIEWVCQKLLEDEQRMFTPLINALSDPHYTSNEELAIQQAERGNITPLREIYPKLARFLCPPKKRQQKKDLPRDDDEDFLPHDDDIEWVAFDVRRIRDLWQEYYNKKRRYKTDGASAYEIAVIYFESHPMGGRIPPTLDEVEAWLKPSGPSGEKRRKK